MNIGTSKNIKRIKRITDFDLIIKKKLKSMIGECLDNNNIYNAS